MPEDSGAETSRVLMWVGLALLVVLLLAMPFGGMWSDDGWGFFSGFFAMMMLFPVLLVVLIVVLVVAIANGNRRAPPPAVPEPMANPAAVPPREALAILERRYANGEVTRAEYLRMREDLR